MYPRLNNIELLNEDRPLSKLISIFVITWRGKIRVWSYNVFETFLMLIYNAPLPSSLRFTATGKPQYLARM